MASEVQEGTRIPGSSQALNSLDQRDSPGPSLSPNSRTASQPRPAGIQKGSSKRPANISDDDNEDDDFEVRVGFFEPVSVRHDADSGGADSLAKNPKAFVRLLYPRFR